MHVMLFKNWKHIFKNIYQTAPKFLVIKKFQTNLTNGNSKNQLSKFLSDRVFINVVL